MKSNIFWPDILNRFQNNEMPIIFGLSGYINDVDRLYSLEPAILFKDGKFTGEEYGFGRGSSLYDLLVINNIAKSHEPKNITVVTDDFGWTALCLAKMVPGAHITMCRSFGTQSYNGFISGVTTRIAEAMGVSFTFTEEMPDDRPDLILVNVYSVGNDYEFLRRFNDAPSPPLILVWNLLHKDRQNEFMAFQNRWRHESFPINRSTTQGVALFGDDLPQKVRNIIHWHRDPGREIGPDFPPVADADFEHENLPLFCQLISLYWKFDYSVTVGVPNTVKHMDHKDPFWAALISPPDAEGNRSEVLIGQDITLIELYFFEVLSGACAPKRIFVFGNMFGWTTLALAKLFPQAQIIAVDDLTLTPKSGLGQDLTRKIVEDAGFNVEVLDLADKDAVTAAINEKCDGQIDLCFLNGFHSEEERRRDFEFIEPFLTDNSILVYHDAVLLKWYGEARRIAEERPGATCKILTRTTSGLGFIYPAAMEDTLGKIADAFIEPIYRLS